MTFTAAWTLSQQQFEVHQVAGFANSALQCNAYFVNVGYDVILAAKVAMRTGTEVFVNYALLHEALRAYTSGHDSDCE